MMPADDALWYPAVLHEKRLLKGFFGFDGETLVSHHLYDVPVSERLRTF
jgi:hypothetical protein